MSFLVDTCVLSELTKPVADERVLTWFDSLDDADIHLSALSVGEIAKGVARLAAGRRKTGLERWLTGLRRDYAERIMPIDADVTLRWGEIAAASETRGRSLSVIDALIAATALTHGLKVATRNTADFQATGVPLLDPWTP